MKYEDAEFQHAYDELTKIVSEEDFQAFKHKFFRSYHVDYEYTYNNVCILIKCDNSQLLVEMLFYDLGRGSTANTFAFHFTQCGTYFEWLGHFTKLRFKEGLFCQENYGRVSVRPELIASLEVKMKDRDNKTQNSPYQWV